MKIIYKYTYVLSEYIRDVESFTSLDKLLEYAQFYVDKYGYDTEDMLIENRIVTDEEYDKLLKSESK